MEAPCTALGPSSPGQAPVRLQSRPRASSRRLRAVHPFPALLNSNPVPYGWQSAPQGFSSQPCLASGTLRPGSARRHNEPRLQVSAAGSVLIPRPGLPCGGPGPASRPRGLPCLAGSRPAPPRGAVPTVTAAALRSSRAGPEPAGRRGESGGLITPGPPFSRRPHRRRVLRAPRSASGGQRHRLPLPASASARDPNFGSLVATESSRSHFRGGRRHLSGAHPFAGLLQVSVARAVSLDTWQGPGHQHCQPGSSHRPLRLLNPAEDGPEMEGGPPGLKVIRNALQPAENEHFLRVEMDQAWFELP